MVYVLIFQRPLKIHVYSSLVALIEDNDIKELGASKSKLEKWKFDQFNYENNRVIISKREAQTTGDIRRKKATQAAL